MKDVVGGLNGYSESLEMRKRLCCGLMERELRMQELLKIPKALMERLTKWTDIIIIIIIISIMIKIIQ